jgi:hypothetical protein
MHSHLYNTSSLAASEEVQMSALRGGCKPGINLLSSSGGYFKFQGMVMENLSIV